MQPITGPSGQVIWTTGRFFHKSKCVPPIICLDVGGVPEESVSKKVSVIRDFSFVHIVDVVTTRCLDSDVHDFPACFEVKGSLRISKLYAPVTCQLRLFVRHMLLIFLVYLDPNVAVV